MKKTVVCMLIAAMTMGSMVTPVFADGDGDATHIYVLTAPEDHGWTGSVATFAKEKIEEVNGDGTYSAELITSADAAEQIVNIEDIIAAGEDNIAVVIQPIDDTVQSAIQQLVDAEIPYVAFDRIIDGVAADGLLPVSADGHHRYGCPAVHGQTVSCLRCYGNHGFLCYPRGCLHDYHDCLCLDGSDFCCYYSCPARFSAVLPESELLLLPVSQPLS